MKLDPDDQMLSTPRGSQQADSVAGLPYPPYDLAFRVGGVGDPQGFNEIGVMVKEHLIQSLPADFDFASKRVLDFGCGVGRVMRHFVEEANQGCEIWGCDIDLPSILWMQERLSPPFHVFHNSEVAHLPLESNSFDLVFAISVFTHLSTSWNQWLAELHRILKPGGHAVYSFLHRRPYEEIYGDAFDEAGLEMLVKGQNRPWDEGGPNVILSVPWLIQHWGDLYDIQTVALGGLGGYQSLAIMQKPAHANRDRVQPTVAQVGSLFKLSSTARAEIYESYPAGRRLLDSYGIRGRGTVPLGGWIAFKHDRARQLQVHIDGRPVLTMLTKDLEQRGAYPAWPDTPLLWYRTSLDISTLAAGAHELRIDYESEKGDTYWAQTALVVD